MGLKIDSPKIMKKKKQNRPKARIELAQGVNLLMNPTGFLKTKTQPGSPFF